MRSIHVLSVLLLSLLLGACSSTGSGRLSSASGAAHSKTVYLRPSADERAAEFLPEVTAELRAAGFAVTSNPEAPYQVAVTFGGGGFDLRCSIIMYEHGVPVVSGKGVNPGWGVWLARNAAYEGVFSGALRQFSARVRNISGQ